MMWQPGCFVDINEAKHALLCHDKQAYLLRDDTLTSSDVLQAKDLSNVSVSGGWRWLMGINFPDLYGMKNSRPQHMTLNTDVTGHQGTCNQITHERSATT